MTNTIITNIGEAVCLILEAPHDGDVFVVNNTTATVNGPLYDLRQASVQQIKNINRESAVDLGPESESFLSALIEHVELPVRNRILSIMR